MQGLLGSSEACSPFAKFVEIFEGFCFPLNDNFLKAFLEFFFFPQDLQTHFINHSQNNIML